MTILLTPSSQRKKTQSISFRKPKTFADIVGSIEPQYGRLSCKSHKRQIDQKILNRNHKPLYYGTITPVYANDPVDYFRVVPTDIADPEFENLLFNELFDIPCIRSVVSTSDLNGYIPESCEVIEMNNSSLHPSRIFMSQLSNSCQTVGKKPQCSVTQDKVLELQGNKENIGSSEKAIQVILNGLRKSIQFSGLSSCKKQSMLKLLVDLGVVLSADGNVKACHLSQNPIDKVVRSLRVEHSIENFGFL